MPPQNAKVTRNRLPITTIERIIQEEQLAAAAAQARTRFTGLQLQVRNNFVTRSDLTVDVRGILNRLLLAQAMLPT